MLETQPEILMKHGGTLLAVAKQEVEANGDAARSINAAFAWKPMSLREQAKTLSAWQIHMCNLCIHGDNDTLLYATSLMAVI